MSLGHGASIVRDGLICQYDIANEKCYSGSGNLVDLSGNSLNGSVTSGTVSNGEYTSTDRTHRIQILNPDSGATNHEHDFSSFTNITVELLYRRNSVNNTGTGGVGQPSYYQGIFNYYWQGGHQIYVGTTSDASSTNLSIFGTTTTLELGDWVYISGVTGIGGKKSYVNGELIGSGGGVALDPNKRIFIGNWDNSWASFCTIKEFRMYNRELSSEEIFKNYIAVKSRVGI